MTHHPAVSPTGEDAQVEIARLVEEHGGLLYSLAYRFCGDRDRAEDLVQEVFLSALRSWEGFRGDASERTWLYTIAAHACQRMTRKRSAEPSRIGSLHELLPFGEDRIAAVHGTEGSLLDKQVETEAREQIEAAIAALPEDFRVPLLLKEIVGLPFRDVGGILGIEEATARSRVHRARLKLRAALDAALPRQPELAPPPAYEEQTCLDLLDAKQDALDRGVPFDGRVICERCRSVFASLDLTQNVCRDLTQGELPEGVRERLRARLSTA